MAVRGSFLSLILISHAFAHNLLSLKLLLHLQKTKHSVHFSVSYFSAFYFEPPWSLIMSHSQHHGLYKRHVTLV